MKKYINIHSKVLLLLLGCVFIFINISVLINAKTGDFINNPIDSSFNIQNSFKVPDGSNSYFDSSRSSVLVITDNEHQQKGGIWSEGRVDLSKNFTWNSSIYFGRSNSASMGATEDGQVGGDGFTITLQNDSRGYNTLSHIGNTLGAYRNIGEPADNNAGITTGISFEIDPYINYLPNDFDDGLSMNSSNPNAARHVAFIYPQSPFGSSAHLQLKTFEEIGLTENNWYQFSYNWTVSGKNGTITISYKDAKFVQMYIPNYEEYFGGKYAHIGYTASTGNATALQAVQLTELPLFSYDLSFDLNNAPGIAPTTQTINSGALATKVSDPSRIGYTFTGWNTIADGSGDSWNFDTSTISQDNVTLYAQWQINKYDLKFDLNNVPGIPPLDQSIEYNQQATPVTNPTSNDYIFKSWNTKPDGSGDTWDFETQKMPANDTTLYAQWTPIQKDIIYNTVTFDLNGAPGKAPASQEVEEGHLIAPVKDPVQSTDTFLGWNTKADGSGEYWNFDTDKMKDTPLTLYAIFKKDDITDNVSKTVNLEIKAPKFTVINVNDKFNPMKNVSGIDSLDGDITSKIIYGPNIDTSKAGVYVVKYQLTNSQNKTVTATQVVLVNDGTYSYNDNYIIHAESFTTYSKPNLSDDQLKKLAKVNVYDISKTKWLGNRDVKVIIDNNKLKYGKNNITFKYNIPIKVIGTIKNINSLPNTGTGILIVIGSLCILSLSITLYYRRINK